MDNMSAAHAAAQGHHLSNEFVFSNSAPTLFMCSLYMVLGILAICANVFDMLVFLSSSEMRKKYMFFIALDAAELFDGLCYILTSIGRGYGVLAGTFGKPITIHDCFFNRYWSHALILGTELPALITIVVSVERILAVHKPKLYNRVFTTKTKIMSLISVVIVQMCFLGLAGYSAYHNYEQANTRHCAIITSTATFYSTFHFTFVVCAYVVSFISLFVIFVIHRRITKNSQNSYGTKKNPQLGLFLSITGISVILVSLPSIVMIGIRWQWFAVNDVVVGLTYSTTGFLSIVNTCLNCLFRHEYRKQLGILLPNFFPKAVPSSSKTLAVTKLVPSARIATASVGSFRPALPKKLSISQRIFIVRMKV